jgi:hypothetical protein
MADVEMAPAAGLKRKDEDTKVLAPSNGAPGGETTVANGGSSCTARAAGPCAAPRAPRAAHCLELRAGRCLRARARPRAPAAAAAARLTVWVPDRTPLLRAGDAPAKKAKGAAGAAKKGGKGAKKATEDTPPEEAAAAAAAAPRAGRVAAQGVRYTDMEASVDEALRRSKADLYVAPKEEAAAVSEAQALEQTHGTAGVRRIFDFKGALAPPCLSRHYAVMLQRCALALRCPH